jgi:signal transduction histidine kinase
MLRLDMAVDKCGSRKEIRSELNQVRELLQECADGLHEVSFSLRPRILSDLGLVPAIRSLAQRVQDASGLRVCIYVGDVAPRFPETVELAAYRIVQEALTNTIKHAHASQVMITVLQTGAYLKLSITDDGQGFDLGLSVGSQRTRLGLRGMRERAEMIGGMLDIQSTFGLGTSIQAKLPVSEVPS